MKRPLCALSLLLLTSCASPQADFAPLPAVTRIEAKTTGPKPSYAAVKKTLSNAGHIARIVAAVDAEKSGWQSVPDGPQSKASDIELSFYSSGGEVRRFTVHGGTISGSLGHEWNLSAIDTSGGVGAGSGAQWMVKSATDAQTEALLAAIGPMKPPSTKSKLQPGR
ncbi:hypothetical protein EON80_19985 [bacterium]|nr:MAG: hypothetical protein EON80_19985 [bacterium]